MLLLCYPIRSCDDLFLLPLPLPSVDFSLVRGSILASILISLLLVGMSSKERAHWIRWDLDQIYAPPPHPPDRDVFLVGLGGRCGRWGCHHLPSVDPPIIPNDLSMGEMHDDQEPAIPCLGTSVSTCMRIVHSVSPASSSSASALAHPLVSMYLHTSTGLPSRVGCGIGPRTSSPGRVLVCGRWGPGGKHKSG